MCSWERPLGGQALPTAAPRAEVAPSQGEGLWAAPPRQVALTLCGAAGLGAPTLRDQLIAGQGGSPPCSSLPHSARCSLAPLMSEFQVPLGRALSGQACRPRLQAAGAAAAGTRVGLPLPVQTRLSWDLRSPHRPLSSEKATLLWGVGRGPGAGPSSGSRLHLGDRMPGLRCQQSRRWPRTRAGRWGLGERGFSQRLL